MIFRWRTLVLYATAVVLSLLLHVALLEGLGAAASRARGRRSPALAFDIVREAMPKPEVVEPEPPPPPERKPKPVPAKRVDLSEVAPSSLPPPPNAPGSAPPEQARPVFGISMSSVVAPGSGSGFSVRVGNTVMKAPEKEYTPPDEVGAYGGVPLYKVSKLPQKRGECEAPYPPEARQLGIQGQVLLDVDISAGGTVVGVKVVRGLGHGLDEAAKAALERCSFAPAEAGGQAVPTRIRYTYTFVIDE